VPCLIGRECCGDLVEHEQVGIARESPGQVEQSEERQRQLPDLGFEVDAFDVHPLQPLHDFTATCAGES
jgi:hypothetical protein